MKSIKQNEKQIRRVLYENAKTIEPSEDLFNKIKMNIYEQECKGAMKNKGLGFKNRKRLVVLGALCIALTSITVIGTGFDKSWVGGTRTKYTSFPVEKTIKEDVGFIPKYTKGLPGGFTFKEGGIGESRLEDENRNVLTKTKHVSFSYTNDSSKDPLTLSVEQVKEEFVNHTGSKLVGCYKGLDMYFYEQTYKFVPPSYELTAEDKRALDSDEIEISFGSDEIRIEQVQGISWYEDGLSYSLMGNDYNFKVEEMIDMARAIIDQK